MSRQQVAMMRCLLGGENNKVGINNIEMSILPTPINNPHASLNGDKAIPTIPKMTLKIQEKKVDTK